MKGYIASVAARRLFVFLAAGAVIYAILSLAPGDPAQVILGKPAIYLYPQEETEVFVNVNLAQGQFDVTEPALGDGWRVTARPDGVLTDETGQNWPYLFWEASCSAQFDFSQGFVVPGRQAEEFLLLSLGKVDSCICLYVNPPDKLGCYLSPTHSPEWTRALSYAAQISMFSNIATK